MPRGPGRRVDGVEGMRGRGTGVAEEWRAEAAAVGLAPVGATPCHRCEDTHSGPRAERKIGGSACPPLGRWLRPRQA